MVARLSARFLVVALAASLAASQARPASAAEKEPPPLYQIQPIVDGAVIVASLATTLSIYAFGKGSITLSCPCNPQDVNFIDRGAIGNHSTPAATASNVTLGLALAAPVILDFVDMGVSRDYLYDMVVYGETLAVAGAFASIAKQIVQRPFPRTYDEPTLQQEANGYRSFYSGHTTLTFAAATVTTVTLGQRYGQYWVPAFIGLGVGVSIAIERVAAGWHFPTDVMMGAVTGTVLGIAIPVVHLRKLHLMPFVSDLPGDHPPGLALSGRWG
jgi:membrane-associated phospholipid phosphatase